MAHGSRRVAFDIGTGDDRHRARRLIGGSGNGRRTNHDRVAGALVCRLRRRRHRDGNDRQLNRLCRRRLLRVLRMSRKRRPKQKRRNDNARAETTGAARAAPRDGGMGKHADTSGNTPCGTSPRTWCPAHPARMLGSPPSAHPDRQRSRMTTADGRSPGSRVYTFHRLPGTRDPSGHVTEDSPLTVAGAAAA